MAYKIIWAPEAIQTLEKIVIYLSDNWSDKEVSNFLDKVENTIKILEKNPSLFRGSVSQNVHEALITKHNLLLYQIVEKENKVELLIFWDTRQNPAKKHQKK
jgi:plasmid stabilization system protein ParE